MPRVVFLQDNEVWNCLGFSSGTWKVNQDTNCWLELIAGSGEVNGHPSLGETCAKRVKLVMDWGVYKKA